jgi:hypothetical protein
MRTAVCLSQNQWVKNDLRDFGQDFAPVVFMPLNSHTRRSAA